MAWVFDPDAIVGSVIGVLTSMVGTRLSLLPLPDGTNSTTPAIIFDNTNAPQPALPFITVAYNGSSDNTGFVIDSGVTEETDPDDPPNKRFYPYFDKLTNFAITIRCEGIASQSILQEVRNKFILERHRGTLRTEVFTTIDQMYPIQRTPDLLSTEYREIASMTINMHTVDRLIDFDDNGGVFDTVVDHESTIKDNPDDASPNVTVRTVTSNP